MTRSPHQQEDPEDGGQPAGHGSRRFMRVPYTEAPRDARRRVSTARALDAPPGRAGNQRRMALMFTWPESRRKLSMMASDVT